MNIKAYAKINLALDILGQREDGYHDVKMIMQQINLWDDITIREVPIEGTGEILISLATDIKRLPTNEKNIAYRAAQKMAEIKKSKGQSSSIRLDVDIKKNIPLEAGLAGGSADAAAVLIGLNKLWKLALTKEQLKEIGVGLGADVPFCIMGGAALSEGIGEVLTKVQGLEGLYVVLSKPNVGISTAVAYRKYASRLEEMKKREHPDIEKLIADLTKKEYENIGKNMKNVFEYVIIPDTPKVKKTKDALASFAPLAVMMSGSGPSVFAIFKEESKAIEAAKALKIQNKETFFLKV